MTWERTKEVVRRTARAISQNVRVSASCESDARLRRFVGLGDPFVRTVLGQGVLLRDTGGTLAALQSSCCDASQLPAPAEAAQYLHSKALFHHRRVHEHLHQILGDLQLSLMARIQALAVRTNGVSTPETFFELSTWPALDDVLRACGLPEEIRRETRLLIEAHKEDSSRLFSEFRQRFSDVAEELERAFIAQDR